MIVADQKPIAEIAGLLGDARKVLVVGCGGCVTVCLSGGDKEAQVLTAALRIWFGKEGRSVDFETLTLTRQCDPEYIAQLEKKLDGVDCVLSTACGVGVQFIAEKYPVWVVPALNTRFGGGNVEPGVWEERCGFCGDCILYKTGGICPIIRCSKSILNGPCGGSEGGVCEVSRDIPCAWQLIYDRLKGLGKLHLLDEVEPPKNWSTARDGGPRKSVREDARV